MSGRDGKTVVFELARVGDGCRISAEAEGKASKQSIFVPGVIMTDSCEREYKTSWTKSLSS